MLDNNIKVGNVIKGEVTGVENYGIFVNFYNNYSGLIHISEISEKFVKNIYDLVKVGEVIYCEILAVDDKTQKLTLSIKNINYKQKLKRGSICETRLGFLPLKNNLNIWLNEKLEIYKR